MKCLVNRLFNVLQVKSPSFLRDFCCNALSKKEDGNMYNLFDEIEKEGELKGKAEGII